jgi:hypothetical protein
VKAHDLPATLLGGLKTASSLAAKRTLHSSATPDDAHDVRSASENAEINFFTSQLGSLRNAGAELTSELRGVHEAIEGLPTTEMKEGVVSKIGELFRGHQEAALHEQAAHTATQWVTYRTRASLGTEVVAGTREKATKLDAVREFDKMTSPSGARGLLDIHVRLTSGAPTVQSARLLGVSSYVANRVLEADLRATRTPVRIVIDDGKGFITRDEVGRVRYSGFIRLGPDGSALDERQQHHAAQTIADTIVGRTLAGWNINRVITDDQQEER